MPVLLNEGQMDARDFGRVSFNGLSEPCAVGSIVEVVINAHTNTTEQQKGSVLVEAHAPTGRAYKCQVHQRGPTYSANFTPHEVGDWNISILYDGEHIRGSPFSCQVYDANLVQVYGLDVGVVGQELKFNVNTSQAGRGDVKVQTFHHGGTIPCYLERVNVSLYKVRFTPEGAGQYKIHVYFNTMEVKGSPFILDIVDASSVSVYGDNLRMACVDKLATFMIHAVGANSKDLTVTITAPSGKKKRAKVNLVGDSVYQIEWKPVEAGEHYVDVRLYGQSVADSPFSCNVGDPDLVTVRNMPSKIGHDDLGEPHTFEIDATTAGSGNLEIMINGGRIHCNVRDIGTRLYLATFTPTQPITHVVEMKFNGEPVKNSPWRIEVSLPHSTTTETTSTSASTFNLGGMGNVILAPINLAQLPPGATLPNFFYPGQQPVVGGQTTTTISSEVERTTLEPSDFGFTQTQQFGGGPSWAEIQGRGLQQACVGKLANFEVGAAGGTLNDDDIYVKILSPSMREIPCRVVPTGNDTFRLEYIPTEVGTHRIDLSLAGQAVRGSPFLVSTYSPNKVVIEPIPGGAVGQPVQFIVDANDAGKGQLEIAVNQGRVPNGVQMQGAGRCLVTFIPDRTGVYVIDVTFNGDLVSGCPVRVEISEEHTEVPPSTGFRPAPGLASTYSYERKEFVSTTQKSPVGQKPPYHGVDRPAPQLHYPPPPTERRETAGDHWTTAATTGSFGVHDTHDREMSQARSADDGFLWREKNGSSQQKRAFEENSTAFEFRRDVTGGDHGYDPRVSMVGSERYNEKDEMEERTAIRRSELPAAFSGGMTAPEVRLRPTTAGESRFGGTTVASYGTATTDSRPYSYYSTIEPRGSAVMSTEVRVTSSRDDGSRPAVGGYSAASVPLQTARRQSEDAVRLREQEARKFDVPTRIYEGGYGHGRRMTTEEMEERVRRELEQPDFDYRSAPPVVRSENRGRSSEMDTRRDYDRWDTKRSDWPGTDYTDQPKSPVYSLQPIRRSSQDASKLLEVELPKKQPITKTETYERTDTSTIRTVKEGEAPKVTHTISRDAARGVVAPIVGVAAASTAAVAISKASKPTPAPVEHLVRRESDGAVELHELVAKSAVTSPTTKPSAVVPQALASAAVRVGVLSHEAKQGLALHPADPSKAGRTVAVPPEVTSYSMSETQDTSVSHLHDFQRQMPSPVSTGVLRRESQGADALHYLPEADRSATAYNKPSAAAARQMTPTTAAAVPRESHDADASRHTPSSTAPTHRSRDAAIAAGVAVGAATTAAVMTSPGRIGVVRRESDDATKNLLDADSIKKPVAGGVAGAPGVGSTTAAKLKTSVPRVSGKIDWNACKVQGPANGVTRVRRATFFEAIKLEAPTNEIKAIILPPSREPLDARISEIDHGIRVDFTPKEVGTHKIHFNVGDQAHPQGPFTFRVYDPEKIHIGAIPDGAIGDPIQFSVDATNAGYGNLEIAVMDKDNTIVQSDVTPQEKNNARFFVSFLPQKAGVYNAHITFNGENLEGSPFSCRVRELRHGETALLAAATAATVGVAAHQVAENHAQKEQAAQLKTAVDPEAAKLENFEVLDGGRQLTKNVHPVHKPIRFDLSAGKTDRLPKIEVKAPNARSIPARATKNSGGAYTVEFTPEIAGDHLVEITQNEAHIPGSPYTCRVYDASKIKVGEIENGQIDQNVSFIVDASEGGVGNLEVAVNDGDMSSTAKNLGQHRYEITFIPRQEMDHVISVKFNGEPVPGSPFVCKVASAKEIETSGPGLEKTPVKKPTHFIIDVKSASRVPPSINIRDPTEHEIPARISSLDDGKFRVDYTPEIIGSHVISVSYNNQPIRDSPFVVKAYDSSKVKLLPVQGTLVGEPASFFIDATKAGAGNMEIIVSVDNRNVPNYVQAEENARFTVSFNPQEPKPHVVSVRFNGEHVPGSPMTSAPFRLSQHYQAPPILGDGLQQAVVGVAASFLVNAKGHEAKECNVIVTDPNGGAVPVRCFQQKDGNYKVEYTPMLTGDHKIEVSFGDEPIGQPFYSKCIDPAKIKLSSELRSHEVNKEVSLLVSKRNAGKGALTARVVERHTGKEVPVNVKQISLDEDELKFLPTTIGQHELHVAMDGVDMPGSPMLFIVDEPGRPGAYGNGLQKSLINEPAQFVIEAKKIKGDLKVEVLNPHGKAVKVSKSKKSDGSYEIFYTPNEIGFYTVNLLWNSRPLSGSPYLISVVDPKKVQVRQLDSASRWSPATVGVQKEIKVDASLAGPGKLRVEVRGPVGKIAAQSIETSPGQFNVNFTPSVSGQHDVALFLCDYIVPNGPLTCQVDDPVMGSVPVSFAGQTSTHTTTTTRAVYQGAAAGVVGAVAAAALIHEKRGGGGPGAVLAHDDGGAGVLESDPRRIELTGDGFRSAKTNEAAEFFISASFAGPGLPACTMTGQKADIPITLTPLGDNKWRASYTPFITGTYNLSVLFANKPVKGSPFKVNVLSSAEVGKVLVNSEPLPMGIFGQDLKTTIDMRRSGPGELTAQCLGPNKIAFCELADQKDGTYLLTIKAQETGKHNLAVKYNGEHVAGSPFPVHFSTSPDAGKVRVYGPGIEHGILSKFKSNFVVDTKGAGAGQLTVRMRGPKGAFNVEMERERANNRLINCRYDPTEPGDYEIEVKWAGEHAPGSPFLVLIFDTQQELERYLAGQPVHGISGPFVPPGFVGLPPPPGVYGGPAGPFGPRGGSPPFFAGPPPPHLQFPPMGSPPMAIGGPPLPLPPHMGPPPPRRHLAQSGY